MVDVLVGHSYFLAHDPKQVRKMRPYPPLATLYTASYLRSRGYTVALFDAMLALGEGQFAEALARHRPRFVALCEDNFNFLSKMCLARNREASCRMIEMARAAGAQVVVSGADVTDHPETYLGAGANYAAVGEPDHTVVHLLDVLSQRAPGPATAVPGLAYAESARPRGVARTPPRPIERHPDVFPFPAWDLVDVERYRSAWKEAHGYFSVNMVSTRGCPFHCNWCAKPIWGQRYAMRSPASVAEELALVKQTLRPDHVWFADDIFGLRPQWVQEFGQEVARLDAGVPFMIQSRVDLMTDQAVAGLVQAGCAEVWLGAESGSQKILDAMDKGTRVEQIVTARARLKSAGIRACFFIQFGYPGETLDDIMATVRMVRESLPDDIGVSVSYPLPGTRFHDTVRQQLGAQTHWVDSDDLAMMFEGTYRSPFYRRLHRLLHRDLDVRRRLAQLGGRPGDEDLRALDELGEQWFELGQLEATERSPAPTSVVAVGLTPAPDLAREWN